MGRVVEVGFVVFGGIGVFFKGVFFFVGFCILRVFLGLVFSLFGRYVEFLFIDKERRLRGVRFLFRLFSWDVRVGF